MLNKRRIRNSFDKATLTYDGSAVLQREVGRRMIERLDLFKINPANMLDIGSGTGYAKTILSDKFPGKKLIELDISYEMLAHSHRISKKKFWPFSRSVNQICGDLDSLPIKERSIDFVWANFVLDWVDSIPNVFSNIRHVLCPGGLFVFATMGQDTLMELRAASKEARCDGLVNDFPDMHDLGDSLLKAGFVGPVVDVEIFSLTYRGLKELVKELRNCGSTRKAATGYISTETWVNIEKNYEKFRNEAGKLPATFEVVYGHAWAPAYMKTSKFPTIEIKKGVNNQKNL